MLLIPFLVLLPLPRPGVVREAAVPVRYPVLPIADVDVARLPRVLSLPVVLSIHEPAPVGVPVGVGHVADAVPLAILVLPDVGVAVGPVVLPGAVEQAVANLANIPEMR